MKPLLDVNDAAYAKRLDRLGRRWWKRLLDVQRPYRWFLRGLQLGYVLDLGCGVGRSLINSGANGVGVDVNPHAVELARQRGLKAFEPAAFESSQYARLGAFDTLLLAHVVEHMTFEQARALLEHHLRYLRPHGRVVLIAPQQAGFTSDPTHVTYFDFAKLRALLQSAHVAPIEQRSFPFPQAVGRWFIHNEFVVIGRKQG